ncbi:hypothetical protein R6Q59_031604 [Mikania micrantha]|uniref:Uncharacterized protein n=1 Tax=Mikania micrantha TaxID=192012 RepID=A0A5N6NXV0_9ASTR|nr:hypothetical protein E3N88_15306 [Mikania micrantha]
MGFLLACLKPICLLGHNKKKEPERRHEQHELHKEEKKEWLLKSDKLTLQDFILGSPRSSSLPITSSKRVYPNPVSIDKGDSRDTCLSEGRFDARIEDEASGYDGKLEKKIEGSLSSKGERTKKKVSFKMPEIADVFILVESPTTTVESSDL